MVSIGGGTGTAVVLSGLKNYPVDITAIVAITDDGGSTGRLRDEFGFLPAGDLRQAIAALSEDRLVRDLLLYRFEKGGAGLKGHNLGNLILTALEDILSSESKGVEAAGRIFRLKGKVLPVSNKPVQLAAQYQSGKIVVSEHKIEKTSIKDDKIAKLYTIPKANINPKARQVILNGDLIILGPGDLYGSTIANLVIRGVKETLQESRAKIVYILNLMTRVSQTYGFTALDHIKELEKYLGRKVDFVLINSAKIPPEVLTVYQKKEDEYPIK